MMRELVDRLRVVGDRAVRVDRDGDRAHAEEAEGHEAEREDRPGAIMMRAQALERRRRYAMPIRTDDDEAHPVGAEVTGGEAGEDVERGAAFARRR